jgi:hypothetical protein
MSLQIKGVDLDKPKEIEQYFEEHPDMKNAVYSICEEASRRFPSGTRVSLEIRQEDGGYLWLHLQEKGDFNHKVHDRLTIFQKESSKSLEGLSGRMTISYKPSSIIDDIQNLKGFKEGYPGEVEDLLAIVRRD